MLEQDYVVDIDDPNGALSSDPKIVYDFELDVGAHDQYKPCQDTVQCIPDIRPSQGLDEHRKNEQMNHRENMYPGSFTQ